MIYYILSYLALGLLVTAYIRLYVRKKTTGLGFLVFFMLVWPIAMLMIAFEWFDRMLQKLDRFKL